MSDIGNLIVSLNVLLRKVIALNSKTPYTGLSYITCSTKVESAIAPYRFDTMIQMFNREIKRSFIDFYDSTVQSISFEILVDRKTKNTAVTSKFDKSTGALALKKTLSVGEFSTIPSDKYFEFLNLIYQEFFTVALAESLGHIETFNQAEFQNRAQQVWFHLARQVVLPSMMKEQIAGFFSRK